MKLENEGNLKIEHIGIWVKDLERMKSFYETWFPLIAGERYHNKKKGFTSYFLTFKQGARIELMHKTGLLDRASDLFGLAHIALSLGSKELVDSMTERLRLGGVKIVGEPRITGDGYYESVISDPEGNLIELTV